MLIFVESSVPSSDSNDIRLPDVQEPEGLDRRNTRSQRSTKAAKTLNKSELTPHPVKSALNVPESHGRTNDVVHDIEMDPMNAMLAQDESSNHEIFCSIKETLDGGSNQNGEFNTK